jgi:hypothetical protein
MKRKIKRFSNGGMDDYDSSDDAKNLIAAAAREAAEANAPVQAPPMKMASFGEAFREARNRGDKTFEWKGKKYTTEMAGEKKAAAPKSTPMRMTNTGDEVSRLLKRRPSPVPRTNINRTTSPSTRLGLADLSGYKKGGSVSSASKRADGCAMRGKTRGKVM